MCPDALVFGTVDMEDPRGETTDAPLLFAVRYLVREYRNCIASLQFMLDENRDLFVPGCTGYSSAVLSIGSAQTIM